MLAVQNNLKSFKNPTPICPPLIWVNDEQRCDEHEVKQGVVGWQSYQLSRAQWHSGFLQIWC